MSIFGFIHNSPAIRFCDIGLARDVHNHILPGVDDGIATAEEANTLLDSYCDRGIRSLTFTPHINPDVYPDNNEERLISVFKRFMSGNEGSTLTGETDGSRGRLDISLGAEYMVTNTFHLADPSKLLQFEPGKVLIEMSYYFISLQIEEAIFNLTSNGLTPVMAHPERYLYLAGNLKAFERFHDMGCEFQMNALSLSGAYGPGSVRIMDYLLKEGMYSYIGTDTHTIDHFDTINEMRVKPRYQDSVKAIISKQV